MPSESAGQVASRRIWFLLPKPQHSWSQRRYKTGLKSSSGILIQETSHRRFYRKPLFLLSFFLGGGGFGQLPVEFPVTGFYGLRDASMKQSTQETHPGTKDPRTNVTPSVLAAKSPPPLLNRGISRERVFTEMHQPQFLNNKGVSLVGNHHLWRGELPPMNKLGPEAWQADRPPQNFRRFRFRCWGGPRGRGGCASHFQI